MNKEDKITNIPWYKRPIVILFVITIIFLQIPVLKGIGLLLLFILIVYWMVMTFGNAKYKRCPKCDSEDINFIKPTLLHQNIAIWQRVKTRTLNVCRNCGFSWEDR